MQFYNCGVGAKTDVVLSEESTGNMVAGSQDDLSVGESHHTPGKRPVFVLDNRIDSKELFSAAREVAIMHGEEIYRLRLTSQNKLILTK